MAATKIVWIILHILLGIILLIGCKKLKTPIKNLLFCGILGVLGLLAVSFTAGYTGVAISLSPYTIATSAILGLPGVILLLALNLLLY